MILVALLYAILASTFIFAKNAVACAKPCFLIGFRMIIAGVLLVGYQLVFRRAQFVIKREDYWLFGKTALFHIYFSFLLEFWALQYLSALKTTLIYSATPFVAAVLSYLILSEHLSWQKCVGIVIGLGGLIPVLLAQTDTKEFSGEILRISLPEVALFGAVVCGAYAWFLVKALMQKGYGFGLINGMAMLIGGILSMGTSVIVEGVSNPIYHLKPFLFWVALLILSANIVVYNFYSWLLTRYSITFITFSGFLCPSFGTMYEWLFMGGTITWHYIVSLCLVTVGLYIFYRNELRSRKEMVN